jgi:hypothetical protein
VALHLSLEWLTNTFVFWLPAHNADTTFEGNHIIIKKIIGAPDPLPIMKSYITSRDRLFPLHAELWLLANGSVPTRAWFIHHLQAFFPSDIAGQSLCAGGATTLAEAGAPPQLIKGAG